MGAAFRPSLLFRRLGRPLVARPFIVPDLPEGQPSIKPSPEDAVHFLIRMVRKYPDEITIYEGGPMTNLAARHFHRSAVS